MICINSAAHRQFMMECLHKLDELNNSDIDSEDAVSEKMIAITSELLWLQELSNDYKQRILKLTETAREYAQKKQQVKVRLRRLQILNKKLMVKRQAISAVPKTRLYRAQKIFSRSAY